MNKKFQEKIEDRKTTRKKERFKVNSEMKRGRAWYSFIRNIR